MVKVKESEIFQINNWKYKVVFKGKEKELHALYKDDIEWLVVSDISEMKIWLFVKLSEKLCELGHKLSISSVCYETIIFKKED